MTMKAGVSFFKFIALKTTTPPSLSSGYKILLIVLSLAGVVLSLLSTSLYGAGISPDSVYYISAARNISDGFGVTSFDGSPFILWPPLYPILLAIPAFIFNLDPLVSAPVINAILFGLIIYFSGLLLSRHLFSSVIFALLGVTLILFSIVLLDIATMAWSESLFIFLTLVFLFYLDRFIERKDYASFIIFSTAVALACLTRYIGMSLILTGVIVLFFFLRGNFKVRLRFIILFAVISVIPIGLWVLRNYQISGTHFGGRSPSMTTFSKNFELVYNILLNWGSFPPKGPTVRTGILIVIIILAGFAGFYSKEILTRLKTTFIKALPIILYIVFYLSFLLYSSTTYAFEQINWRYLSPIYIQLTILFLVLFDVLFEPFRKRFSVLFVNSVLTLSLVIWLVCYPMRSSAHLIHWWMSSGTSGYSNIGWRENDIIKYLKQNPFESGHLVFTNDPLALYILADLKCQKEIVKIIPDSAGSALKTKKSASGRLNGGYDYFVWFNNVNRQDYPYTKDELEKSANMKNSIQLKDGTIFLVQRQQ
jgi:hypothetical protein